MISISRVCRADRGRGETYRGGNARTRDGFHHIKHLSLHLAILTFFVSTTVKNGNCAFLSNNSEKNQLRDVV